MTALHLRGIFLPDERERDAWIVEGRLTFEPVAGAETIADRGWVLPGFIDAHCHIGLKPDGWATEDEQVQQAILDRDAGALLLRDAGSPVDNRAIQDRDDLPRLIRAGRHIARPKRYIRYLGVEVEPEELVAEVERQAALGDGWIKLAADWIDRGVGDLAPTWPDDALAAAVARAHELGVRVAAHVFGEDALPGLINAGLDSIEHGTGLTEDLLDEVARRGIAVVPTLINIDTFPGIAAAGAEKYPGYAAHMLALHATSRQRIRNAYEAGIAIYPGTDAGGSLLHGLIRDELTALVQAGIPQAEVIAQASWRGRSWLGLDSLVENGPADLVVYAEDPRSELATLHDPKRIVLRGNVIS
ncbi:MAG: amidohydrolase family protein [Actinomycetota bacterium]|nr:amidohydrolase family protein [Actinomycetota bacterium]MDQ2957185.1 amidohydrolase family protein [Actinomycetota bacterium]